MLQEWAIWAPTLEGNTSPFTNQSFFRFPYCFFDGSLMIFVCFQNTCYYIHTCWGSKLNFCWFGRLKSYCLMAGLTHLRRPMGWLKSDICDIYHKENTTALKLVSRVHWMAIVKSMCSNQHIKAWLSADQMVRVFLAATKLPYQRPISSQNLTVRGVLGLL